MPTDNKKNKKKHFLPNYSALEPEVTTLSPSGRMFDEPPLADKLAERLKEEAASPASHKRIF